MGKKKKTRTAEEIRIQKMECERKRRARIKADSILYENYKRQERERYEEKKRKEKVKLIAQMTSREQRIQRREWRLRKARSRTNRKKNQRLLQRLREDTPDTSSEDENRVIMPPVARSGSPSILGPNADTISLGVSSTQSAPDASTSKTLPPQKNCSPNAVTSPCSPATASSSQKLTDLSTPSTSNCNGNPSRFSLRSSTQSVQSIDLSDSTNTSQKTSPSRQKIKAVQASRRQRDEKNLLIKFQKARIEKQAKKIHALQVQLSRLKNDSNKETAKISRPKRKIFVKRSSEKLASIVTIFLERDDNSKMCPGKKDVITRNKIKKQKRYLSDTMVNLCKKLKSERNIKISLATFCRLRPFWIVPRHVSERDTCMCIIHENIQLQFDKLKYLDILPYSNLNDLCKDVVCDNKKELCMLRKCTLYKDKQPNIQSFDGSEETTFKKWCVNKEKRIVKGKEKEIRRTVKDEKKTTKKELVLTFLQGLEVYLHHEYKIKHQYKSTTLLKENLTIGEIFMQIDFSENYGCKYGTEVQSAHWTKDQVSLHTGVYYYRCPDTNKIKCKSFCTFSECLRHDAAAVCAHLQTILDEIVLSHMIHTLHILSDSPSSQYRNRKMFYIFTQHLVRKYNIEYATWNFCEAGHGKGPMDGVGAVVKRTADRIVGEGKDIPDCSTLIKRLEECHVNIKMSVVSEELVKQIDKILSVPIKNVPGTTKIHQISWSVQDPGKINARRLTCVTCAPEETCQHYSLPVHTIEFLENESRHVMEHLPSYEEINGDHEKEEAEGEQSDNQEEEKAEEEAENDEKVGDSHEEVEELCDEEEENDDTQQLFVNQDIGNDESVLESSDVAEGSDNIEQGNYEEEEEENDQEEELSHNEDEDNYEEREELYDQTGGNSEKGEEITDKEHEKNVEENSLSEDDEEIFIIKKKKRINRFFD